MQVVFVGDVMLSGDQAGKQLKVSKRLKKKMSFSDLRIATLETAVGTYADIDHVKSPRSEVAVWSKEEDLHKLLDLNINVVSIANNHACDCGIESMLNTVNRLHRMGISTVGGGRNLAEAMAPAILEKDGESLAIIACCQDNPRSLGSLHFAEETKGGVYKLDEATIIPHIQVLKQKYTYVAIIVHWGIEHKWLPENSDVSIGKKLIDAGADIIIGGHPHHIQPVVAYKRNSIFYSLGNFYFPDFYLDKLSNAFYPDQNMAEQLPKFDLMDPGKRNFSMLYFWKYYSRLGIIATIIMNRGAMKTNKSFVVYRKGTISFSLLGWWQRLKLVCLSHCVGEEISTIINSLITRLGDIIEYKILGRVIKKYGFYNYVRGHNYED